MFCVTRIGLFFLLFALTPAWAITPEDSPLAGEIVVVQGKVMIRSEKQGAGFGVTRVAEAGGPVYPEDVINTASESKIKILLKDKTIVDLGPSSLFKVDHFDGAQGTTNRKVDISMAYGTMRTAVTQKLTGTGRFKVKTPSATMGVRGTEFIVQSDLQADNKKNNTTQVTVLQGEVGMLPAQNLTSSTTNPADSKEALTLKPGMQVQTTNFAAEGQNSPAPPKTQTLDANQMTVLAASTKVADTTFQKAVTIDPNQNSSQSRDPASSSSPSNVTHPAIVTSVAVPPPPVVTPSALGVPGSFNPNLAITQTPVNPLGSPTRLHVVIVMP